MNNLEIWDKLGKTDPSQTKAFKRSGGFKGTAIKPVYTERKMTETFGPVGTGWGFSEPTFKVEPGANGEVLVFCWLSLWYVQDGKRSDPIPGVGGDKLIAKFSSGLASDDEAFKKAFTDAIGNAMKHLGMSADVHMGRFDDSKYVSDLTAEASAPAPVELTAEQKDRIAKAETALRNAATLPALQKLWTAVEAIPEAELPNADYERLQNVCNERIAALKHPKSVASETTPFDEKEVA